MRRDRRQFVAKAKAAQADTTAVSIALWLGAALVAMALAVMT